MCSEYTAWVPAISTQSCTSLYIGRDYKHTLFRVHRSVFEMQLPLLYLKNLLDFLKAFLCPNPSFSPNLSSLKTCYKPASLHIS